MSFESELANLWTLLTQGQVIQASIGVFTMGLGDWFFALILFFAMVLILMKTEDFGTTILTGLLVSSAVLGSNATGIILLPVQTFTLITIMVALSFAFILYKLFR